MTKDLSKLLNEVIGWAPLPWVIEDADIRDVNDGMVAVDVCIPESALSYMVAAANAVPELEKAKNCAYNERNRCVAFVAKMAVSLGWRAGLGRHDEHDETWGREWMNIVYVDTPHGQASWHFHDRDLHLFSGLPFYDGTWDGHSTPEKYDRLAEYVAEPGQAGVEAARLRSERDHYREKQIALISERDAAISKAAKYELDWVEAKHEFGTSMAKLRDECERLRREVGSYANSNFEGQLSAEYARVDKLEQSLDARDSEVKKLTRLLREACEMVPPIEASRILDEAGCNRE